MMYRILSASLVGLALSACGGSSGDGDSRFSLAVTDAPVDEADEVIVTFTGVELQGAGEDLSFTLDQPVSLDLLSLQGDRSAFLIEGEAIPPGQYTHIRLLVDALDQSCQNPTGEEASYVVIDGVSYPITVPSGGLRINAPLTIAAGGQAAYTVDFDLRKSLAERGATGCYNIRPTALRVVDNAEVGHLAGTVDPELLSGESCAQAMEPGQGSAVYVYSGDVTPDDLDTSDDSNEDPLVSALLEPVRDPDTQEVTGFSYNVGFLLTGSYTVALTCNAAADVSTEDNSDVVAFQQPGLVAISAGETSNYDFVAAQPTPAP